MSHPVIHYFETLDQRPLERMVLIISGMLLLWVLEGAIPLLTLQYKKNKWRHAAINFSFTIIHLLIHTGFAFFILLLSDAAKHYQFGLIHWFHASTLWT